MLPALVLLAAPVPAAACSYCVVSILNLLFPFMWTGIWILGVWRLLDVILGWRRLRQRSVNSIVAETLIVLWLALSTPQQGGLFLYLVSAFVYSWWRTLRRKPRDGPHPVARWTFALQFAALLILLPVAGQAYRVQSRQDALDWLRFYVYSGTGQSRALAQGIAEDKTLDSASLRNRLREMLESPSDQDVDKALEVLSRRGLAEDLIAFQDLVLKIPEEYYPDNESSGQTTLSEWNSIWFRQWFRKAVGPEVKTREDLTKWLEEQKGLNSENIKSVPETTGG
jgi:hypothetical protein